MQDFSHYGVTLRGGLIGGYDEFAVLQIDGKVLGLFPSSCDRQFDDFVDRPLKEPRAVCRAEAFLDKVNDRGLAHYEFLALSFHLALDYPDVQLSYLLYFVLR